MIAAYYINITGYRYLPVSPYLFIILYTCTYRPFIIKAFLAAACFFLSATVYRASAQKTNYLFKHLTTANGLVSNSIKAILQDRQGYVWIGTQTGLQRYDGKRFKTYMADIRNPAALQSDWISTLFEDSKHRLWIGTSVTGAAILNRNTGQFHNFNLALRPGGKKINGVWQFLEDKQGRIWIAAYNGFYRLEEATQQLQPVDSLLHMNSGIRPSSISMDPAGDLWFCTTGGIKKLDIKTGKVSDRENNPQELSIFKIEKAPGTITFDDQGNAWISTGYDSYLFRYRQKENRLFTYTFDKPGYEGTNLLLRKEFLGTAFYSSNKQLLVPLFSRGIAVYNYATDSFSVIAADNTSSYGFHLDRTTYSSMLIREDVEKNIWIGTDAGINITNLAAPLFTNYFAPIPGSLKLKDTEVSELLESPEGDIYVAYYVGNGGIKRFDKDFNLKQEYLYRSGQPDDAFYNQVWALFRDAEGIIWAPNQGGTILKVEKEKADVKMYSDTSLHGSINQLQLDNEKNTWIAHEYRGLVKIAAGTKNITNYSDFKNAEPGERKRVLCMLMEGNLIWVGTVAHGLQLFDKRTGKFTVAYQANEKDQLSISNNTITGILSYNADTLIVATQSGINIFDKHTKTFTNISSKDGLPNNLTQAIVLDRQKNLWAAFAGGLSKINFRPLRIINYDENDGIINNQFNHRFLTLSDGRLAIGASKSFLVFDPAKVTRADMPPDVTITGFKVFGKPFIIDSFIINKIPFELSHTDNSFEIEFASLQFNTANTTKYFYQLEGIDKDWIGANEDGTVNYNKLPPGNYTFKVKCANREGVFSKQVTSFSIHIIFPFYQRTWFLLLCALIATACLYAFMKWREKNIKALESGKTKLQQLTAEKYKSQFESEQISSFFSTSLLNKNDVDDVLWDVAKNLISKLGFVDCMIYLWNADKTVLVQKAGYGPKGSIEELENKRFDVVPGQGIVGTVAETGNALIIADTSKDARYRIDDEQRLSEICVPIKYNEQLLGIIDCEHHERNFFTGRHLQLLTTIATLVAGKIKSIEAEQRLRHQRAELADINQQLAEVQLAALRSQMNPHFIFNALNSIKKFVIANEPANAEKYLGKFSKLIRSILDNSQKGMVTVEKELQLLKLYLDLEQLRFGEKLTYDIAVDKNINALDMEIPSMIVQPFVENAMLHGIMHKENGGHVGIRFLRHNDWLEIIIEDDGVGRKRSAAYKSENGEVHHSVGIHIATKRLQALKKNKETPAGIAIIDLQDTEGESNGTKVIISIPVS
jgi:ligand-binding sensor domain-containing protein/putative methionine-R-sulfoxide reductase with GAF domain/anti-sigma regulatory factor (Ser/Thr protein kinase)